MNNSSFIKKSRDMKFETNLHLCFFDSKRAKSDTKRAGKHRPQWLALDIVVHIH